VAKLLVPDGFKLLPFQVKDCKFFLKKLKGFLAHEMGLGKTIMLIVVINSLTYFLSRKGKTVEKVLIIAPAIMRDTWAAEWQKWSVLKWNIEVIDSDTPKDKWGRRFPSPDTNVLIVSYEYISNKRTWKKFLELYDFDCIVADEWHYCKNMKAARTKKALLLMRKAKYKFVLTGTPYCRNVMDLYSQLIPFVPADDLGVRIDDFGHQFSYLIDNGYGMNWEGLQNEERLIDMCRPFMKRRLFHKTIKDLPPLTIQHIPINIPKSIAKKSLKYVDIALQQINGQKAYVDPDLKDHVSTMAMQLGISKCRAAVEYTLLKLEGVECLLLAAYHKDVIAVLQKSLKKKKIVVRAITGATPDKKRQMYIRNFQKGKYQVLIVQMKAGGVGITLTRAHYGIAAELNWSPNIMNQVMRRNYRIGQKYPCQWDWLVAKNSLDSQILPSLNEKTRLGIRALGDAA
jgi:SWI/SNF-related matrix-associated actin-dependent regulator 1 of chromatin subfamily A